MSKKKNIKKTWSPSKTQLLSTSGALMVTLLLLVSQVKLPQIYYGNAQVLNNCTVSETELTIDSQEQAMLTLINNYREQNGVPTLALSPNLTRASTWLSIDMNTKKSLSHTDSLNRAFSTRIINCGYNGDSSGENIALNGPAEDTFKGWVGSPAHNANMLNPRYTAIGIAKSGDYWTTDFGSTNDSGASPIPSSGPMPTSVVTPTYGVIVPCTNCVSPSPIVTLPDGEEIDPTQAPEPSGAENEEENQPTVMPSPGATTPNPDGNAGGFIELLLNFLKALLELFMSLFGK